MGCSWAPDLAKEGKYFCIPEDLSVMDLRESIIKMAQLDLAAFPEDQKIPASVLVGAIIYKRYACKP